MCRPRVRMYETRNNFGKTTACSQWYATRLGKIKHRNSLSATQTAFQIESFERRIHKSAKKLLRKE